MGLLKKFKNLFHHKPVKVEKLIRVNSSKPTLAIELSNPKERNEFLDLIKKEAKRHGFHSFPISASESRPQRVYIKDSLNNQAKLGCYISPVGNKFSINIGGERFRDFIAHTLNITPEHAELPENGPGANAIYFLPPLLTTINSEILLSSSSTKVKSKGSEAGSGPLKDDYLTSPEGEAAIQFAWKNYYSTPYTMVNIPEFPASYWDVLLETPNGIVHRPNHGLAHILRVANAVRIIADCYNTLLLPNLKIAPVQIYSQQFTAIFSVIGRTNDTGYKESEEYQKKMGLKSSPYDDHHKIYVKGVNKFTKQMPPLFIYDSQEAMKDIDRQNKNPAYKEVVSHIYWAAHNIDLMRCYDTKTFDNVTNKYAHNTKCLKEMIKHFTKPMLDYHQKVIFATGDRCMGYGPYVNYDLKKFGICSKDYKACLKAINSVPKPKF